MELPIGFDAPNNEDRKFYVLRLNKSLYGLKQARYNWFAKLSNGLQDCGLFRTTLIPVFSLVKSALFLLKLMIAS
jgi:hypothetical protein